MILIMGQISLGVTSSRNYLIIKNARRQYTLYCWTMKILILETLIFLVSSQSINISRPEVATSGEDVFSNPFCDLLSCTNKNAVCLGKCCDCSCNYQRTYLTQSNECQANNNFRTGKLGRNQFILGLLRGRNLSSRYGVIFWAMCPSSKRIVIM